jgi:hypothetical protein
MEGPTCQSNKKDLRAQRTSLTKGRQEEYHKKRQGVCLLKAESMIMGWNEKLKNNI